MESISSVARRFSLNPQPVICLDTCDLLNRLEWIEDLDPNRSKYLLPHEITEYLASRSPSAYVVATWLVKIEFDQRIEEVKGKVDTFLRASQNRVRKIRNVWDEFVRNGLPPLPPFDFTIPSPSLSDLIENDLDLFLANSTTLEEDANCTRRALERLFQKLPPAEKGEIKDAIHLEHYLELASELGKMSYPNRCYFVSSDKRAFWNKDDPKIRPDLAPEFSRAGLEFIGGLDAAFGRLIGGKL